MDINAFVRLAEQNTILQRRALRKLDTMQAQRDAALLADDVAKELTKPFHEIKEKAFKALHFDYAGSANINPKTAICITMTKGMDGYLPIDIRFVTFQKDGHWWFAIRTPVRGSDKVSTVNAWHDHAVYSLDYSQFLPTRHMNLVSNGVNVLRGSDGAISIKDGTVVRVQDQDEPCNTHVLLSDNDEAINGRFEPEVLFRVFMKGGTLYGARDVSNKIQEVLFDEIEKITKALAKIGRE